MKAMERYKRENRRPFPTWSEVLEVLDLARLPQGRARRRTCRVSSGTGAAEGLEHRGRQPPAASGIESDLKLSPRETRNCADARLHQRR